MPAPAIFSLDVGSPTSSHPSLPIAAHASPLSPLGFISRKGQVYAHIRIVHPDMQRWQNIVTFAQALTDSEDRFYLSVIPRFTYGSCIAVVEMRWRVAEGIFIQHCSNALGQRSVVQAHMRHNHSYHCSLNAEKLIRRREGTEFRIDCLCAARPS